MGAVQLLLLFFAGLAVHSRPLISVHPLLPENQSAFPTSGNVLSTNTPLDPLRSKCVRGLSDEARRIQGHRKDQAVLRYLRQMISVCRYKRHREMRWAYEHAWDFAAETIYGPLPARPEYNMRGLGALPPDPPKPTTPPIWKQQLQARPLRRIIRRFTEKDGSMWEVLQCGHRVGTSGFESLWAAEPGTLAKSRRCDSCAQESADKKKPTAAAGTKTKAVTA
jgi:hypothetical protein